MEWDEYCRAPLAHHYCSTLAVRTKFSMRPLYFQSLVMHAPLAKYAPAAKDDGMSMVARVDVSVRPGETVVE